MATQKPISSISYNTLPFLREKLDLWVSQHIIQTYQYIRHKGEDGDKDHTHFRIEPNKKLDPMVLEEALKEYPLGCEKPLGIRPWRPSKEEDWFLYAVHDPEYMALKYPNDPYEKLPYDWHDIVVPDNYDLEVAWVRAKAVLKHSTVNMVTRIRNGENPIDLIMQGENVFTVNGIMRALSSNDYNALLSDFHVLKIKHDRLLSAIKDKGLSVHTDDDGNFIIE